MPRKMTVEVNGKQIEGVLNVEYKLDSEWDNRTGKVKGEFRFSPLTIYREMQSDSPSFFRWAHQNDKAFPAKITFKRLSPTDNAEEDFLTIELDTAVVISYEVRHQDWKDERLGNYDPLEIVKLGYKKVKMSTPDDNYQIEFKK